MHSQKRQVRPSANRTSLKLGLVSRPASSGRLARLVVALGAIRFAPSRRHRPCRADAPDRSCRVAAPTSLCVARIRRAGARGPVCDCASACCSSAVSQACVSLVVRGVRRRSSERHRRAADKRLLLPVIWLVAERQQARTADSERERHTQLVSAFRRGGAGVDAPDAHEKGRARRSTTRCHSASCRTLGAHWHTTATHIVRASLFLLDETIGDVSPSQI